MYEPYLHSAKQHNHDKVHSLIGAGLGDQVPANAYTTMKSEMSSLPSPSCAAGLEILEESLLETHGLPVKAAL
jgi:hypothetical protein